MCRQNSAHSPDVFPTSFLLLLVQLVDVSQLALVVVVPENREAVVASRDNAVLSGPDTGQVGQVLVPHYSQAVMELRDCSESIQM